MPFVLDASIALAWLLPDEGDGATDALADRLIVETVLVPPLWSIEVANALLMAARRGRISADQAESLAAELVAYPIEVDRQPGSTALSAPLTLAAKHGITVYDAAYAELAQRRRLPLATLDRRLRQACAELNIPTLPE